MIKEYIDQLQEENRERLHAYDLEMRELTQDLTGNEHLLSTLQAQKQDDKNIFSPRSVNSGTDEEIKKTKEEITSLKRRMDYVSQMLELEVKNRDEYEKLAEEAAKEDVHEEPVKENVHEEPMKENAHAETVKEDAHEGTMEKETVSSEDEKALTENRELIDFLNSVCKKVQLSASLVKSNKNRCRSELRSVERMLRNYVEDLQEPHNE